MSDTADKDERIRRWAAPRDPWEDMRDAGLRWRDIPDRERAQAFEQACRAAWEMFQSAPDWKERLAREPEVDPVWEAWWKDLVLRSREKYGRR